jgi:hypothetical protein
MIRSRCCQQGILLFSIFLAKALPNVIKAGPLSAIIATLMIVLFTPLVVIADLIPFQAVYKADYEGLPIAGEGVRELVKLDDSHYRFSASVSSFMISIAEQSEFKLDQSGNLIPAEYQYHRRGIGEDRDAVLKFNWVSNTVLNDVQAKPWSMPIPVGVLDKLGYQIRMRNDLATREYKVADEFNYSIADGGKLKNYQFRILAEEVLETGLGSLRTVKVEKYHSNGKRSTIFWLARDWEFLLVRMEQSEPGKSSINLHLKRAIIGGVEMAGT